MPHRDRATPCSALHRRGDGPLSIARRNSSRPHRIGITESYSFFKVRIMISPDADPGRGADVMAFEVRVDGREMRGERQVRRE